MVGSRQRVRSRADDRRSQRRRKLWLLLVVLVAWYVALGLGTRQPEVKIQTVAVSGGKQLTPNQVEAVVRDYLEVPMFMWWRRDNALLLNQRRLRQGLQTTFPEIATVHTKMDSLRDLVVVITEYEPVALWCWHGPEEDCYYMSAEGLVYGQAPEYSAGILTEYRWRTMEYAEPPLQGIPEEDFRHLRGLEQSFEKIGLHVIKVERVNDYDMRFYLDRTPYTGAYIAVDVAEIMGPEWDQMLTNINTVLQTDRFIARLEASPRQLEYIDARLSTKIYYRFHNDNTSEE